MQTDNRLFDDFVKFVNGAAGTLAGVARETEGAARERAREWIGGMDFVSREEFEAVKAMAVAAPAELSFRWHWIGKALQAALSGLLAAALWPVI